MTSGAVLHTHALTVTLDGAQVLHNVSVDNEQGSCTAILGPNGSGKTTFLRAALGLVPATGDVLWFGRPGSQYRQLRRVSLVPQLLPSTLPVPVSVREFVESAFTSPAGRLTRWRHRSQRRAAVGAALAQVDLTSLADRPVDALSGGQQRRVLFARAIVTGSDVLLLDEPLAGVDLDHQADLVDIMRSLRAAGSTLVIVAHELDAIAPLVDQVVLFGGTGHSSIVYQGTASAEALQRLLRHEPHHPHELRPSSTAVLEI